MNNLTNGLIQNFPVAEVGTFIKNKGNSDFCKRIANKLVNQYLSKDLISDYPKFLALCAEIEGVKNKAVGASKNPMQSKLLMYLVAASWANMLRCDENQVNWASNQIQNFEGPKYWFYPHAKTLHLFMDNKRIATMMAQSVQMPNVFKRFSNLFQTEKIGDDMDAKLIELIQMMGQLRSYGLKPAAYQDPYSDWLGNKYWMIQDPLELKRMGSTIDDDYLAIFTLSDEKYIGKANIKLSTKSVGSAEIQALTTSVPTYGCWALDKQGHIDLSLGHGMISLKPIFERADNLTAYNTLRFKQVMRIYDLLVPLIVADQTPSINRNKGIFPMIGKVREAFDSINDLIIPRLHSLEKLSGVQDELIRELEEDLEETRRRVKKHDVIGFRRKVRAGYVAPRHIVELALKESDIILLPGETYVKAHSRGDIKLGRVIGHKVK